MKIEKEMGRLGKKRKGGKGNGEKEPELIKTVLTSLQRPYKLFTHMFFPGFLRHFWKKVK